jgi:hypothetical protein
MAAQVTICCGQEAVTMATEKDIPEPRFIKEQYDRLIRCSDARDMSDWNRWRKYNRNEKIYLEKA